MFKDMKVATRLALGFGAAVVLLLVLSVISVLRLGTLNDATKLIMEDRYPKVVLANSVIRLTIDNGLQLRSMLLSGSDEEREKYRKIVEGNRPRIVDSLAKLEKMIDTEKGRQLFKDITDKELLLNSDYDELYSFTKSDPKKAVEFLKSDFAAANAAYAQSLDVMATFQSEEMDHAAESANVTYVDTRRLVFALSALAVFAAAGIAAWITVNLTRLLGGEPAYAVDVMQRISRGDLKIEVVIKKGDVTSMLYAVKQMVATLGESIGDVVRDHLLDRIQ